MYVPLEKSPVPLSFRATARFSGVYTSRKKEALILHHLHMISLPNSLAIQVFHPILNVNETVLKVRKRFMYI